MPSNSYSPGYPERGLTAAQVQKRIQAGQVNTPPESPTKSVRRIVLENCFSFFNLIFFIIAGFLIAVRSYDELIFLLVVAANTIDASIIPHYISNSLYKGRNIAHLYTTSKSLE